MFTPRKGICLVAGLFCVLGIMPVTSCMAQAGRQWEVYTVITVNIKRSAQQVWHPICRIVTLQANGVDVDRWKYKDPCAGSGWHYETTGRYLNYSWSPADHLSQPTGTEVDWCAKQYTPEAETITVSVNDDGILSQIDPPDSGSRDDQQPATASVTLGAFDVKASLTVSGTNRPEPLPPLYAWWSEHDEYMHYTDPDWVEPQAVFDAISLAGGPITLGEADNEDTDIIDVSTRFPTTTFRGTWVLSSEPDGVWTSDRTNWAGCYVDQNIEGSLHSEVWDWDWDPWPFGNYVTFTPPLPDFKTPISWNWDRIAWDLIALAATEHKAEGGVGLGMAFQSNYFAPSSNWQGHGEVKHQSKDYFFSGDTPDSKTVPFSYGPSGEWWQFDTSVVGGNSIQLYGDIDGKVEIVEDKYIGDYPAAYWHFLNAYAKAWSEGLAGFWLDDPYYGGTAQPPDDGYVP
jgi:hypothetical protein